MSKNNEKVLSEPELRRKYKNSNKADIILPKDNVIRLPSRVLPLNHQIGGGPPYGKMLELFGWESTGKSLLAMDWAYATQALGGVVLWADMENAWANQWADDFGLDTSEIELLDGDNAIEHFSDWAKDTVLYYRSKLTKNQPILLVGDSIAAGETINNLEGDQSSAKADMGNRAKAWDKMYRMRIPLFKKYGVTTIMINQLRGKVGASMFESAETTPGGKATGFYASVRLALVKGKQLRGKQTSNGFKEDATGDKCGQNVTIQVKKNKTSIPRESVKTEVYFTEAKTGYTGYNKYLGLDEMAISDGVVTKKGNSYSVGSKLIASKRDGVLEAILEIPKLRSHIINKLGINTISKTAEQAKAFGTNLYKVGGSDE
jgi:recombination protein RecA